MLQNIKFPFLSPIKSIYAVVEAEAEKVVEKVSDKIVIKIIDINFYSELGRVNMTNLIC